MKKKTGKKTRKKAAKRAARKPSQKKAAARKTRKKGAAPGPAASSSGKPARNSGKPKAKKRQRNKAAPLPFSELKPDGWTLRLYIAGDTPKSKAAQENLARLCDKHLPGKCRIEVIDLVEHPELARADQVLAIPTLVRKIPVPIKRIIGDLSNEERAMLALDLRDE